MSDFIDLTFPITITMQKYYRTNQKFLSKAKKLYECEIRISTELMKRELSERGAEKGPARRLGRRGRRGLGMERLARG